MRPKIILLSVIAFAAGFYMLSTPTIQEASAFRTTVNLNCKLKPYSSCGRDCNRYHDCLVNAPAGGCDTERNNFCDCLQSSDPQYDCSKIPNTPITIGLGSSDEQITWFEQDPAALILGSE